MPLPILLGILGAGLAAQAGVQGYGKPWAEGRQEKARGNRFNDVMSGFDPDTMDQDDAQRMMAGGGLIGADVYSRNGFADHNSARDFAETIKAQSHSSGLASGRASAAAARARDAATLAHERQMERAEHTYGLQDDAAFAAHNRDVVQQTLEDATVRGQQAREKREMRAAQMSEQTAAIQTATEAALAPLDQAQNRDTRILQLAQQVESARLNPAMFTDVDIRAMEGELQTLETAGFYDYVRSVYGAAEPGPAALKSLQASYPTYSGLGWGGSGSWDSTTERIRQRQNERQGNMNAILEQARTNVSRITGPTDGLTRRPQATGGNSGGGIPNSAVTVD